MTIRVLRSALNDLAVERAFYEQQQEGLGAYFFNTLFSDIDSLIYSAGVHRTEFGYHRLLSKRFPYAVNYQVVNDEAVVYRVLDCR